MAYLTIDHADGRYSTRLHTDDEAGDLEARGFEVVHLEDRVYEAYLRHCDQDAAWQATWRAIENEQYMRRREKELMPLEAAEREIARLKEDLARAQRLSRHFEEKWSEATGIRLDHHYPIDEFTCIFPQPGCDVDALESDEWRLAAADILKKYRPNLAADGIVHQGCCCGHSHKRLSDEVADRLRKAGFLVENDSESAYEGEP